MQGAEIVRFGFIVLTLVLTGCRSSPMIVDVFEACDIDRTVWREVSAPLERETLIDLPDDTDNKPNRDHFVAISGFREIWFEDSSQNLQVCLSNQREQCRGSDVTKVIFNKLESSWSAGPAIRKVCVD
jgi:hypothetical protein